ncbi:hypothetical protein OHA21_49325 [Actinoplanes sp. NBC_00393]|uniref:hypothetical protein n=1 Tax=Actinoplanes sp. NBC_00393 TaxID=2975953 RepID=UPI002E1EECB7
MPIARLGAASAVAALLMPATPAAAAAFQGSPDCSVGGFTARSQADLAKITVLDPGPLAPDLPALADVRLAVAQGRADSSGKPHKAVATGRYADGRILGIPLTDAAAVHRAPSRSGPAGVDLAGLDVGGIATVKLGRATAAATWEDGYRCGRTGPLTRSATMLGGLSVFEGNAKVPGIQAINDITHSARRTSLLRVGPTGSTQSATDLVPLRGGRIGVRSGAGVALGDLSLFAGTPQEVSIKVVTQPTLEVTAGGDRAHSKVDYRPAVLEISTGGKKVSTLKDAGADVSLSLLGRITERQPSALAVRLSLGKVRSEFRGRQVGAEASTLRLEVKIGRVHLLDVALGHLSVAACAPAPARGRSVTHQPVPTPAVTSRLASPSASPSASATPSKPPATQPVAVSAPIKSSGGTGGGALALTGTNVAAIGVGGAGLVVAGVVALVLGRRRQR